MWEQLELNLCIDEPKVNVYFAKPLTSTGVSAVGQFINVLDKNETLKEQVVTTTDGQLFVIKSKAVTRQFYQKEPLVEVTPTDQNLEQFLSKVLQSSCFTMWLLFDE